MLVRIAADPTIVSQKTGINVYPRQLMEDGSWMVSVDALEAARSGAQEKLRPFLHPVCTLPGQGTTQERHRSAPAAESPDTGEDMSLSTRGTREQED